MPWAYLCEAFYKSLSYDAIAMAMAMVMAIGVFGVNASVPPFISPFFTV